MPIKNCIARITLTVLGIFIFQISFCQKNYLPGYIIPLKGDTLKGFIDYRNWEHNPGKVFFKEKLSDKNTVYTPMNSKSFGVLDEVYKSAIIQTEISPDNTNNLQFDPELNIENDTAFLQTMIQGAKNLYFYINKQGRIQFYIKQDSGYELLVYKKYLKERDGERVIMENNKYIGQLTIDLADCPNILSKIWQTKYTKKSMENLFLYYYDCTQSKMKFQKKTEKTSTEFGALAGLSLTTLKFKGNDFPYLANVNYKQSTNFSAGLFFNIILPRNQKKWSICNSISFAQYKVDGSITDFIRENYYTITNTKFEYSYLKLNNLLRYSYPIRKLCVFVNVGISNGYVISEKNYKKQTLIFYSPGEVTEGKAIDNTRKLEECYVLGLGTKFKRYSFEMRYEKGNGMSDYLALKASTLRYYFLFGYRF